MRAKWHWAACAPARFMHHQFCARTILDWRPRRRLRAASVRCAQICLGRACSPRARSDRRAERSGRASERRLPAKGILMAAGDEVTHNSGGGGLHLRCVRLAGRPAHSSWPSDKMMALARHCLAAPRAHKPSSPGRLRGRVGEPE